MKKSVKINGILSVIQKTCHIVIPLLTFPYLSRVLGAENYGKFSFANSIINYFILAAMLGINTYAVREGARIRDDKAKLTDLISELFTINLLTGLITIFGIGGLLAVSPKIRQYDTLIYILALIIPATVLGRDYLNSIYEDYFYITLRYIVIQIIGIILLFLIVKKQEDYTVYTWIYTFTASFGYIINLLYTRKYIPIRITSKLNLKKHLIPILILFCGQIATIIYVQSDITMIGLFLDDTNVGIYTFSSRIYILAKSITNAVTVVAIPRIVYYLGKKELEQYHAFASRIFDYLLSLTVPASVGLLVFSEEIVIAIGGAEYLAGTDALRILSIALLFAEFSGFFCNAILVPNRKEKQFLYITIVSACLNIGLNVIFIPKYGIISAAVSTLISEITVMILAWFVSRNDVKLKISLKNTLITLLGSTVIALICVFAKSIVNSRIILLAAVIPLSAAIYFSIHIIMGNPLYSTSLRSVIRFITRKKNKSGST